MSLIDSFWGSPRENPTQFGEAIAWASKHKYGAAIGLGGVTALVFLRPASQPNVIVVHPSGPVNTAPANPSVRRALGIGTGVAVAVGVALSIAEKK